MGPFGWGSEGWLACKHEQPIEQLLLTNQNLAGTGLPVCQKCTGADGQPLRARTALHTLLVAKP